MENGTLQPKIIRMKTHLLVTLFVLAGYAAGAQTIGLSWVKQYGGPSTITPNSSITDAAGAVITCGSLEGVSDFDPGPGSQALSSNGAKDAYIAKLTPDGNYAWAVVFGASLDDAAFDVATDAAGNVYCTGEFRGTVNFNPNGTAFSLTAFSGFNAFIAKYTSGGQLEWVRKFAGSTGYESGKTLVADPSGNVISSGTFYGIADFDPGVNVFELGGSGYYGAYTVKLSTNGEFVWAKTTPGNYTVPNEMAIDENGNIYNVGIFYSSVDFNPGAGTFTLVGQYYDTYIQKLTPQGDFVWARHLTSSYYCYAHEILVDEDENIYLAGAFNGTTDFDPDLVATQTITITNYQYRAYLLKLDENGLFQYLRQLAPNCVSIATGLARDAENNIYVAGYFAGSSDFNPDPLSEFPMSSLNGYEDIFLTKFDPSANFITTVSMGGTNYDYVTGLSVTNAGPLVLSGSFLGTSDFDPSVASANLTSAGMADAYIARLTQCTPVTTTESVSACGSLNYNGMVYTESGAYQHTFTTVGGCDSTVTLNVTINESTFANITLYVTGEIEYNGQLYTQEGNYQQNLTNASGCDSTLYIYVDLLQTTFSPTNNGGVLSSGQAGTGYQWVDCNNGNAVIPGANDPTFTPEVTGSYAVIVYGNNGSVTSQCVEVLVVGLEESALLRPQAFPNPCREGFYIQADASRFTQALLLDATGRVLWQGNIPPGPQWISMEMYQSGLYIVRFSGHSSDVLSVVKM